MTRRPLLILATAGLMVASFIVGHADAAPGDLLRTNNSGGGQTLVPKIAGTPCWRLGSQTFRPEGVAFSACSATTSTTVAATTTVPTTSSTTTIPPTSTTPTSTTLPPAPSPSTTSPPSSSTTLPASGGDFVETFTGNTGLNRFDYGVHHRDDFAWADTWPGDHDLNCGAPDTQRTIHRSNPVESFYLCADHLMTAMGDASSYTVAWFEPEQTFAAADTNRVAWDVNVTNLGQRKWWEVMIIPADYESGIADCPHCAVAWWLSPSPSNLPPYPEHVTVAGLGPLGGDGLLVADGEGYDPFGWCHTYDCVDVEGSQSKVIRRPFSIVDNRNGTITFEFFGDTYTYPGSFPSQFRVVFKDHNYTPSKDGPLVGFTWHWDSIAIT